MGDNEDEEACAGDIDLDVDRDWTPGDAIGDSGGGCSPAQLGIRTISSISNVRASMTCKNDVCSVNVMISLPESFEPNLTLLTPQPGA
jgi:hypothetical protein